MSGNPFRCSEGYSLQKSCENQQGLQSEWLSTVFSEQIVTYIWLDQLTERTLIPALTVLPDTL